jgi:hypothetical protein
VRYYVKSAMVVRTEEEQAPVILIALDVQRSYLTGAVTFLQAHRGVPSESQEDNENTHEKDQCKDDQTQEEDRCKDDQVEDDTEQSIVKDVDNDTEQSIDRTIQKNNTKTLQSLYTPQEWSTRCTYLTQTTFKLTLLLHITLYTIYALLFAIIFARTLLPSDISRIVSIASVLGLAAMVGGSCSGAVWFLRGMVETLNRVEVSAGSCWRWVLGDDLVWILVKTVPVARYGAQIVAVQVVHENQLVDKKMD